MESNIEVALAAKLMKLFPPTEDTYLAFPVAGAAFTSSDLDIFETGEETAEQLRERQHRKAQLARLLNQIPKDSVIYEPQDRLLWAEYDSVLERAQMAKTLLSPAERKQLAEARGFLTDEVKVDGASTTVYSRALKAYYRYKEAYEQIELTFLDEEITAEASTDPAAQRTWRKRRKPQLLALKDKAMQDWLNLGHKGRVESAQAVVTALTGRNPEVQRLELQNNLEACRELDLAANDPNGVFSTFYSPSDSFATDAAWQKLNLTKEEIRTLLDAAPQELSGWKTDAADQIESATVEYANVVVIRPWFDPAFFEARSWDLPGKKGAVVSNGKVPREGRIPAFITSMIVARKVSITRISTSEPTKAPQVGKLDFIKRYNGAIKLAPLPIGGPGPRVLVGRVAPSPPPGRSLAAVGLMREMRDDHRIIDVQMGGVTVSRPPVVIPPPPPPPVEPETPAVVTEEMALDGVVVLAYRCRRIPESPRPDRSLEWKGGRGGKPKPRSTEAVPAFPLPAGHWYGAKRATARAHSGETAEEREAVTGLQQRLSDLGFAVVVDGEFDSATVKAVRRFQKSRSLKVSGRVDAETWSALWTNAAARVPAE